LPEHPEPFGQDALKEVACLFALDAAAMAVFAAVALLAEALGIPLPHHKLSDLHPGPLLLFFMVLVAPALEESVFRGWLSGTRRALSIFGTLAFVVAVALLTRLITGPLSAPAIFLLVAAATAGVVYGVVSRRQAQVASPRYRALFPLAFWLSVSAFATAHLANYVGPMGKFALLWVTPQFVGATFFGYARVRFGMWANISLHAAHNSLAALMVLLGN